MIYTEISRMVRYILGVTRGASLLLVAAVFLASATTVVAETRPIVEHRVPGFGLIIVPRQAVYAKRRLLFTVALPFEVRVGSASPAEGRAGLWVAPTRDGGSCHWKAGPGAAGDGGCAGLRVVPPLPSWTAPDFYDATICCQVGDTVVRLELRFQDGSRIELYPRRAIFSPHLPLAHYGLGRRLREIAAYDKAGDLLATRAIPTHRPGIYPCIRSTSSSTVERCVGNSSASRAWYAQRHA